MDLRKYCWDVSTPQSDPQIECNPYQTSNIIFSRNGKTNSKIHTEFQGSQIVNTILKKRSKVEVVILPNFEIYYKAIVIKTILKLYLYLAWGYIYKERDQWNRLENPEINAYISGQLIFNSSCKDNSTNEWSFQQLCWDNYWIFKCKKKVRLDFAFIYLRPYTKINSKLIKELKIRMKTIKLLGENIGADLHSHKLVVS